MNVGTIFVFVIYMGVAAIMIGIGISQLKSKEPVGFYSGEKPPRAEELSDVGEWNRRHGMMWLIYGAIIILSFLIAMFLGDSIISVVPMCGGILMPVFFMVRYHRILVQKYKKQ